MGEAIISEDSMNLTIGYFQNYRKLRGCQSQKLLLERQFTKWLFCQGDCMNLLMTLFVGSEVSDGCPFGNLFIIIFSTLKIFISV